MAAITWSNDTPGDDATASLVDDILRSDWTAVETGLETEMYWTDGSSGSAGETKLGAIKYAKVTLADALRAGNAPNGHVVLERTSPLDSSANDEATQEAALWHAGSQQTMMVGNGLMEEHNTQPSGVPFTARWVISQGTIKMSLDSSALVRSSVTFDATNGVPYNGVPDVQLGIVEVFPALNGDDDLLYGIESASSRSFASELSLVAGGGPFLDTSDPFAIIAWQSMGTLDYGVS